MSTAEFAVTFKEAGRSVIATRRPWREFLHPSALSLPSSLSDVTTRISQNLTRFLSNYCLVLLFLIFLGLIYHPFSMIVFLLVFVAWFFLYFSRDDPVSVFGFVLDDLILVIILGLATGLSLAFTGVFVNVLISLAIGAVVVFLHAALRGTEDHLGDLQDPFGDTLLDSPRGDYSGIWLNLGFVLRFNHL